jgi:hypothetical protein
MRISVEGSACIFMNRELAAKYPTVVLAALSNSKNIDEASTIARNRQENFSIRVDLSNAKILQLNLMI